MDGTYRLLGVVHAVRKDTGGCFVIACTGREANSPWVIRSPIEQPATCLDCQRILGLWKPPPGMWDGELITVSFADVRALEILKGLNLGQPLPSGFFVVATADRGGDALLRVLDYRRRPSLAARIRQVARGA